jgi:hypothetical protein
MEQRHWQEALYDVTISLLVYICKVINSWAVKDHIYSNVAELDACEKKMKKNLILEVQKRQTTNQTTESPEIANNGISPL